MTTPPPPVPPARQPGGTTTAADYHGGCARADCGWDVELGVCWTQVYRIHRCGERDMSQVPRCIRRNS